MPLNAVGWTTEEDENLVKLVQPHPFIYNVQDPSRKNILARESTWQDIARQLAKPVEECKKRWRGLRDGYMRSKRMGTLHKSKASVFNQLQFLDGATLECHESLLEDATISMEQVTENQITEDTNQPVFMDNDYYEITVVDSSSQEETKPVIKLPLPLLRQKAVITKQPEPQRKIGRKNCGRKKSTPLPRNIPPIKILPKPTVLMNGPKLVSTYCVEDPLDAKQPDQRLQNIDKLVEKVLKESTNEIDVFFRSMAASVKKLQPNLIPKVKMEVCNVIAKYEMQSFDIKPNINM